MTAAPARPRPPVATEAAPRDISAVSALISVGPPAVPTSPIRRQTPRNSPRPVGGEKSAPRVMTMPLPRPLPKPLMSATISNPVKLLVSGMAIVPTAMMSRHGTATHFRPRRSMTIPTG
ncbi:MAG: hypothetical protein CVU47_00040 [Chloroflexi bacterium HGW-Chloroflexi-9]|nr:MAG: hypothetical protein CVU47_00040 [Chloroflexi bacterium HGW-Chloroflexi-9]